MAAVAAAKEAKTSSPSRRMKIGDFLLRRLNQRSEEHTSELQSHLNLLFRLLLEKKKVPNHLSLLLARLHSDHSALFFFFNDTAPTEIYTLSLHDALPISSELRRAPILGGLFWTPQWRRSQQRRRQKRAAPADE